MQLQWTFITNSRGGYTCRIDNANIEHPNTTITSFYNDSGYRHEDYGITEIEFSSGVVKYFPRGLRNHFRSITHLKFESCGLKEIKREDLKEFPNLVSLSVIRCNLTSLPDDLFVDMKCLTTISFSGNQIELASSKFLEPFEGRQMQEIDLTHNKGINCCFKSSSSSTFSMEDLMDEIGFNCELPAVDEAKDFFGKVGDLWSSGRFSDLTIDVGTKKFRVHKSILSTRSSVFEKIIEEQIEADEIKIQEFSESSVEHLLSFFYTGKLPTDDQENVEENLKIAIKFEVPKMEKCCFQIMRKLIDQENCFEYYKLGFDLPCESLKQTAFKEIAKDFEHTSSGKLPVSLMEKPDKLFELITAKLEMIAAKRSFENLLKKANE